MRATFINQLRQLFRLASVPAWAEPTIVALGFADAVLEGTGLLLFIPMIQHLGAFTSQPSRWSTFFAYLIEPIPEHLIIPLLLGLVCLSILLKNIVSLANVFVSQYIQGRLAHQLRCRIFDQTILSCIDYRVDVRKSDIVTTLANNSWNVSKAYSIALQTIVSAVTVLIFIFLMLSISVSMTFFSLVFVGLSATAIRAATLKAEETGKAVVEENKDFGLRMWESLNSLELIRAFAREDHERYRFREISDRVRRRLLTLDLLAAIPAPMSEIIITIFIAVLILVANSARIDLATLVAFLSLLYRLQGPTREIQQSRVTLDSLKGAIDDVDNFLQSTTQPFLTEGNLRAGPIRSSITFSNVSFRYAPNDDWAIDNVSFEIPAGKTTAIIGESGAGKSTILALLFRFYDPTCGEVHADGTPLRDFTLASWRARLAMMAQEVILFNDTIEANIGYGDFTASAKAIRAAAKVSGADSFIETLPKSYATGIGDAGMRLSGGQRQRIALARTVLRNPDILLLDEATNALDVESEQAFQMALEKYAHNRTVVVIAHRLSTVQMADQIIVMAKGRVVEVGTPIELLQRSGHYSRLHDLQRGRPTTAAS